MYLVRCPFNGDHGQHTETSLMQHRGTGQPAFKCMHNGCVGKGWQDFKAAVGRPLAEHYDPPLKKSDPRVRQEPDLEPITPISIGKMIAMHPHMRRGGR